MLKSPGNAQVVKLTGSEKHLIARTAIARGETVLEEAPVVCIPLKARYLLGSYSWDLVHTLLSDAELLRAYARLQLLAEHLLHDHQDLAVENWLVKHHRKSRQMIRNLFFSVGTNNIGVLDAERSIVGYGVYETLSRADHSCAPNTRLEPGNFAPNAAKLVAYRDIAAGEPLTWSYFREDEFLHADYFSRNYGLVNVFRFACRCPRCLDERPAEHRGIKDLRGLIDSFIGQQANDLIATPAGLREILAKSPMELHRAELRQRGKLSE